MAKTHTLHDFPQSRAQRGPVTITVKAEKVEHRIDRQLGDEVADQIRDAISRGLRDTKTPVSAATLARRRAAGRTSTRYGYDTGRLAAGLRVVRRGRLLEWLVQAPPERLRFADLGDRLRSILQTLQITVLDPKKTMRDPGVRKALQATFGKLLKITRR